MRLTNHHSNIKLFKVNIITTNSTTTNMIFNRSLILVGGSGELGSALTRKFAYTKTKKWRVFNIDFKENNKATKNFILPRD